MPHIRPTSVYKLPWRRAKDLLESDAIILSKSDGSGGNVYVTLAEFKDYILNSGASPTMRWLRLYNFINSQPDRFPDTPDYIVGHKSPVIAGGPFLQTSLCGTLRPKDYSSPITVYWDYTVKPEYPYMWQPQLEFASWGGACRTGQLMQSVEDQPTIPKLHGHAAIYLPQTSFNSVYIINYRVNFRAYGFSGRIPPAIYIFKGRVGFASMSEDRSTVVDVTCINELFAYVLTWEEMVVAGTYLYYKPAASERTWLIPIVWCSATAPFFYPGVIQMETHYSSYGNEYSVMKLV